MFLDLLISEVGDAKGAGGETRFNCPFCTDHKHKMYVCNSGKKEGQWTCFKCGESGNPVSFVMKYFMMTYTEATDLLLQYDYDVTTKRDSQRTSLSSYGSDLTEEEQLLMFIVNGGQKQEEAQAPQRFTCPPPPTNCKTLVANFNNPEAFPFFMYLHGRGVTMEHIKEHNICYVTNGTVNLVDGRTLTLTNHVVFFTFDSNRKPIYWNTRSIEKNAYIKSFNAPSRPGEYSKDNTVFNLNNAQHTDKIVITEGVFNALTVGKSGVATFGKQVTDQQLSIILSETRERRTPIYLFLDTDAWKQMIGTATKIRNMEPYRPLYYVYTGTDEDANDIGSVRCKDLLANAILANSDGDLTLQLANL